MVKEEEEYSSLRAPWCPQNCCLFRHYSMSPAFRRTSSAATSKRTRRETTSATDSGADSPLGWGAVLPTPASWMRGWSARQQRWRVARAERERPGRHDNVCFVGNRKASLMYSGVKNHKVRIPLQPTSESHRCCTLQCPSSQKLFVGEERKKFFLPRQITFEFQSKTGLSETEHCLLWPTALQLSEIKPHLGLNPPGPS